MNYDARNVRQILRGSLGKKCWYVSVGGCTLPQFKLALGKRVRRESPVPNRKHPRAYREFEGEVSFFVRCWWRLEHGNSVVVSSSGQEREIARGLNQLVGKSLVSAKVAEPAWDLVLEFSDHSVLRIFANQTDGANDALKNWHARVRKHKIYAGPGAKLEIV